MYTLSKSKGVFMNKYKVKTIKEDEFITGDGWCLENNTLVIYIYKNATAKEEDIKTPVITYNYRHWINIAQIHRV
jgi:hypothetical protein